MGNGRGRAVLERNVFIGAHAIVLRSVRTGENSVVADAHANVIVANNPARIIKHFTPFPEKSGN